MSTLPRISFVCLFFLAGCASLAVDRHATLRLEQAHPFGATALAYDHDGRLLATGGFFGEARVWHMPDGAALASLPGNHDAVRGIAWMDENTVVVATEDGRLTAWDWRTHRIIRTLTTEPLIALLRVPGTQSLVVADRDTHLRLYTYPTLAKLAERQLEAPLRAIAVSRDGRTIAAATSDHQVLLLDAQLHITRTLTRASRDVLSLRFSPDGRQLAAGTWFKLLFWDVATGQQTSRDTEHFGAIISIDYTPDGKKLVSLGRISDSSLRLTNVATGEVLSRMAPLPLCGWMARVSPDGHYVAAGSESGDVDLFDLESPGHK